MSKIVVLNGNPGAGKNTFADMCGDFSYTDHISYVDLTRSILDTVRISYHNKTKADRQLIEAVNDALEKHSDIPFKDICRYTENFSKKFEGILFVDIRKPENIKRFCEKFPEAVTVFVDDGKPESDVTVSDSTVKGMTYDYVIMNKGTMSELKEAARSFVNKILTR